ncbi:uncharacterized protein NESG_00594 [Nematocida ausubeli]|uniref:Uncharacterized protein n=1 Tax=Nematocida ausubeli (strain ATCC PRA-371 / ERTm2) TaxID=1913371 RepID=A0A086J2T0_NEMA1|nr:uncharacterized protein NESG_00594 [Nematocida ausubeli]KFG26448.1 hypothetical protein NESG_00594 [Nematocida ausubeli]
MKASKKELSIKSFLIVLHTIILYCIMAHDISIIYYSIAGFILGSFAFKSTLISSICVIAANLVRYTKTVSYIPLVGVLASSINNLNEANSSPIHSTTPEPIGDFQVFNGSENIPSISENITKESLFRRAENAISVQERNALLQQAKYLLSEQEQNDFLKWQHEHPELADEEDALLKWKVRKNFLEEDEIDKKNEEKELNDPETNESIKISDNLIDKIVNIVCERLKYPIIKGINKGVREFFEQNHNSNEGLFEPSYSSEGVYRSNHVEYIPLRTNRNKEDDRSSTSLLLDELPSIESPSPDENEQNPNDNADRTKKDKNTRRKPLLHVKGRFYQRDDSSSSSLIIHKESPFSIRAKQRKGLIEFMSPDKSSDSLIFREMDNKELSLGKNGNNTSDDAGSGELSDDLNGSNPKCNKSI